MGSDNGGDEHDLHEYGGGKAQYNPHWTNVCGTEITITVSNPTGVVGATDPELNGGGDWLLLPTEAANTNKLSEMLVEVRTLCVFCLQTEF